MAHEQPLPEFFRRQGDDELANVMQEVLRRGIFRFVPAPAAASSTGLAGDLSWDGSYFYICTAKDTWLRVAIATW